jgi:3',5'-cyclic AMP phosphodiesterase CpdA
MLIAHLSDLHLAGTGNRAYGRVPVAENLGQCVTYINRLRPQPDIVVLTGDITGSGQREEAEQAARLLSRLPCPLYMVPGNHDKRSSLSEVLAACDCPALEPGGFNYVIEGYAIRLIGMNSCMPDAPGGEIRPDQLEWLEQRLAENPEQPTILFMHHPPLKFGVLETDEDGFAGAEQLGQVIERYSNIVRILCGHIHLEAHAGWRSTVVSTAPSMGLQLSLDLTLTRPSEFFKEAPGFLLHYFTPDRQLITHTVYVRDLDGPYLFEEIHHSTQV